MGAVVQWMQQNFLQVTTLDGRCDSFQFIQRIDRMQVNTSRIFMSGFSNGAMLTEVRKQDSGRPSFEAAMRALSAGACVQAADAVRGVRCRVGRRRNRARSAVHNPRRCLLVIERLCLRFCQAWTPGCKSATPSSPRRAAPPPFSRCKLP